jgi:SOS-response transcriptional repressor LexA
MGLRSLAQVRREANENMRERVLGFRMRQIQAFVRERIASGEPEPSLGELKRELDFYDKAGALRALRRLQQRDEINNNP